MTGIPQLPGWYPDPADPSRNLYWDGQAWHRNGAPSEPSAPQQQVINLRKKRGNPVLGFVVAVVAFAWLTSQCSSSDDGSDSRNRSDNRSAPGSGDSSLTIEPTQATPTNQPEQPGEWAYMPGNGIHEMGGVDGKNWGVWESDGTTGVQPGKNCTWSIRSVARYRPGIVLDEGEAPPGEKVRVSIQADGDVSVFDGTIGEDDHRIVFMTNNCGAWTGP